MRHTTHICACGNILTILRSSGDITLVDSNRSMVCPSCGHWLAPVVATVARQSATRPALALADAPHLAADAETQPGPTWPLRATLRAIQGLLRLALQHIDRLLEEPDHR
jgi:hypothetical protein